MMSARSLILLLSATGGAAFALGQAVAGGLSLRVDGKAVPGKTLVSGGQSYVPLATLRAAGVTTQVSGNTLSLGLPVAGGVDQVGAVEGKVGDWLFNGVWRFRIIGVGPNDDGRPGWKVQVELRNGTKMDSVALGGTGLDSVMLVMADATEIKPYNITDFDRPVGQGGSVNVALVFYDDEGNGRKPAKLIIRLAPDAETKAFLRRQGAAYTVADPSFRVRL